MKIGILTFHRAINYGAVLQCYSLYRKLSGMGHDVEVIDYRPAYIERYRNLLNVSNKSFFFTELRFLLRDLLLYKKRKDAINNFDEFLSLIKISQIVREFQDISAQKYDIILSGSDQIWNRRITDGYWDKIYCGQFNHEGTKFASYASSFGVLPPKDMGREIKEMLQNIDAVSVREKYMADYLRNLGLEVDVCVDPTILVNENIFNELAVEPTDSNFILVYALKDRSETVRWAKKIQQETCMDIIVLGGNISGKTNYGKGVKVVQGLSPRKFLGYFKKADYVVNTSFHGTVFSTIFRKDFYSLNVENSERYKQYLQRVGLLERFVNFENDPVLTSVDYTWFDGLLESLIEESNNYLKKLGL